MTGVPPKGRGALEVILFEEARFRGSLMFTSTEVTVGSDPGVMIRLDDPEIAACHAVLNFDGETCSVANFDGILGTLVNGVAVEEQVIEGTDEVSIGRFRLRITVHKADATPPPVSVRPPGRPVAPPSKPAPAAAPARPAPVLPAPPASPIRPPSVAAPALPAPVAPPARPASALPAPVAPPARPASALPAPVAPAARPAPALPAPVAPPTRPASVPAPAPPSRPATVAAPAVPAIVAPVKPVPAPRQSQAAVTTPPTAPARSAPESASAPAARSPRVTSAHSVPAPVARNPPVVPAHAVPEPSPAAPFLTPSQPQPHDHGTISGLPPFASLPVPAVGPAWAGPVPDDDDEDDDTLFAPAFSLLEGLRENGTAVQANREHVVQVVRFRQGCVLKLGHLRQGEKLRLPGLRKPLGRNLGRAGFVFDRDALPEGAAVSGAGQPIDHKVWRGRADKRGRIALDPTTQVVFPLPSGDEVLVHLVPAAGPLPKSSKGLRLSKFMIVVAAASVVVHLVVFAILGMASLVRRDFISENKEGRFARIALKEIELEPPAPPPKREKKKPKAEPSPTAAPSENTPKVASARMPRTRASAPQTQASATAQKLLSALGGLSTGNKPMSATAMSNLAAVGPVRGGGFKVSGAIGKLPGDSLRLAAAGSGIGRLDTKSTNDVGKNLGRVLGRGTSGQVRAQVTAKPNAMKVEGHLDRGEIQRVINAHIFELQGCFERQLISNPNLAGKVSFEWVIGLSGAVTTVRIKSSSLSSNEATSCMQSAIRRWQFPSPKGGTVTVIYPIALASSGT